MKQGYVYVLRCNVIAISTQAVPYKIGNSTDPSKRLAAFAGYPDEVEKIHQIATNDCVWLEQLLHSYYRPKRGNGEWFALDDHDLETLQECVIVDKVPEGFLQGFPAVAEPECEPTVRESATLFTLPQPAGFYEALAPLERAGWAISFRDGLGSDGKKLCVIMATKGKNVISSVGTIWTQALDRASLRADSVGLLMTE